MCESTIPSLLHPSLHGALQQHVLPLLAPCDLATLAATCSALHTLVLQAGPGVWLHAAQRALPWHQSLPTDLSALRHVLARHARSSRNLSKGICTGEVRSCAFLVLLTASSGCIIALLRLIWRCISIAAKMTSKVGRICKDAYQQP